MSTTDTLSKTTPVSYKENLLFFDKLFASLPAAIFIIDLHQNKIIWSNEGFHQGTSNKKSFSLEYLTSGLQLPQGRLMVDLLREHFSIQPNAGFTTMIDLPLENGRTVTLCLSCKIFRKTESAFEVACTAIEGSFNRETVTPASESTAGMIRDNSHQIINKLSKRELQLARYFAQGHPTKVIAEHFNLSVHTINNHRKNVLRKLGCRNIASFVYFAMKNGLK